MERRADIASLKILYLVLIRSRLHNGSVVYGSAAKIVLSELNVIMAQAPRLCLGTATSLVCAIQAEAGEMLLCLRRKQLRVNYWMNLRGHGDGHPTKTVLQVCWEREGTIQSSFGWTGDATTRDLGVHGREFCLTVMWPTMPVWVLEPMAVDLELLNKVKTRKKSVGLVRSQYTGYVFGGNYRWINRSNDRQHCFCSCSP